MKQTAEMHRAINYLDEHFPKGDERRGDAMVLLALAQIGGRSELKYINAKNKK